MLLQPAPLLRVPSPCLLPSRTAAHWRPPAAVVVAAAASAVAPASLSAGGRSRGPSPGGCAPCRRPGTGPSARCCRPARRPRRMTATRRRRGRGSAQAGWAPPQSRLSPPPGAAPWLGPCTRRRPPPRLLPPSPSPCLAWASRQGQAAALACLPWARCQAQSRPLLSASHRLWVAVACQATALGVA